MAPSRADAAGRACGVRARLDAPWEIGASTRARTPQIARGVRRFWPRWGRTPAARLRARSAGGADPKLFVVGQDWGAPDAVGGATGQVVAFPAPAPGGGHPLIACPSGRFPVERK
jgi:hypothetical protein